MWMNAVKLAGHLSVSVPTIHRWAKLGHIPRGKRVNGGFRLWHVGEVERYLGVKTAADAVDWIQRIEDETRKAIAQG